MLKYLAWVKPLQIFWSRIIFMTWGREAQDVAETVAWLMFSHGKTQLAGCCSLPDNHECFSIGKNWSWEWERPARACSLPSCQCTCPAFWMGWISWKPVSFSFSPSKSFSKIVEFPAAKSLFHSLLLKGTLGIQFLILLLMYFEESSCFRSPWLAVAIQQVTAFIFVTRLLWGSVAQLNWKQSSLFYIGSKSWAECEQLAITCLLLTGSSSGPEKSGTEKMKGNLI